MLCILEWQKNDMHAAQSFWEISSHRLTLLKNITYGILKLGLFSCFVYIYVETCCPHNPKYLNIAIWHDKYMKYAYIVNDHFRIRNNHTPALI